MKPCPDRLKQYVDYINNTGLKPLPVEYFDEDFEPIGQMVRREMETLGLIHYVTADSPFHAKSDIGKIMLRPDLSSTTGSR